MVYAGFWRRFMAHAIDVSIQVVCLWFVFIPISVALGVAMGISDAKHKQASHVERMQEPTLIPASYTLAQTTSAPDLNNLLNPPKAAEPAPRDEAQPFAPTSPASPAEKAEKKDLISLFILLVVYPAVFLASIIYHTAFVASSWQATPGKRLMGCMVVTRDGGRLHWPHALARHLACAISGMTVMIGYMLAGWTREKTALHDMICNTRVVRTKMTVEILTV